MGSRSTCSRCGTASSSSAPSTISLPSPGATPTITRTPVSLTDGLSLMGIGYFLQFGFAQHALEAAFLVAASCGLIGPFVITRSMAFAVHGTSELAFTGAVGGLLVSDNPLAGALIGALVV